MIRLLREDCLFERLSGRDFVNYLLEYLEKTDTIMDADDYVRKENGGKFDASKKKEYGEEFPIKDIKDDIYGFIDEWLSQVYNLDRVKEIEDFHMSKQYGFSNYFTVVFTKPERQFNGFFFDNRDMYKKTFRFSEHDIKEKNKSDDIFLTVNLIGKTFEQAAAEMLLDIENYIIDLKGAEKQWLKKQKKQKQRR